MGDDATVLDTPPVKCSRHGQVLAAWTCSQCDKALCEDCAAPDWLGKAKIARCSHCGGLCDLIVGRKRIQPLLKALSVLFKELKTHESLIQLLALSVIMLLCWFALLLKGLLQGVFLISYMLVVVKSASEGQFRLPEPSADQVGGTFSALMKLLVASWMVWTPLLAVYAFWGDSGFAFTLALLAAMLLFPGAVLVTALGYSLVALANPLALSRVLRSLGIRYWEAAGVFSLAIFGLFTVGVYLEPLLSVQPVPFVGDIVLIVLAHGVQAGFLTVGAFAVGWCAYEAGDKLSLWTEEDLIVAQVPDATPRARAVRRLEDRIDDEREVDIELSTGDALASTLVTPSVALEVGASVDTYEIEELPEDQGNIEIAVSRKGPETLEEALEAGDARRTVEMYDSIRRASGVAPALTPARSLQLADCLVAEGRYKVAATEYRRIAKTYAEDTVAPHAISRLAELLSMRLNRPDMAATLLDLLAQKYPGFPIGPIHDPNEVAEHQAGLLSSDDV